MSVAVADLAASRRMLYGDPRTEVEVAADVVAQLLERGVLRRDPRVLAAACAQIGIPVAAVREAHQRLEARGYRAPRGVAAAAPAPTSPAPAAPELDDAPTTPAASSPAASSPAGRPRTAAATAAKVAKKNPAPGKRRCSKCLEVKPLEEFRVKSSARGYRHSWCAACQRERAKDRYLSVERQKALNAVGLTFVVVEGDDVTGIACLDCGQAVKAGDEVHARAGLRHTRCPETGGGPWWRM